MKKITMKQINFLTGIRREFSTSSVLLKFLFLFLALTIKAQVGINTDSPDSSTALDVNGKLRVRDLPETADSGDKMIVADSDGNLKKSDLLNTNTINGIDKSSLLLDIGFSEDLSNKGKGDKAPITTRSSALSSSEPYINLIKFNAFTKGDKSLYDTAMGEFTAPSDGLYFITSSLEMSYKTTSKADFSSSSYVGLDLSSDYTSLNKKFFYTDIYNSTYTTNILLSDLLPLKKGQKLKVNLHLSFHNYSTPYLNFNVKKSPNSYLRVYKIL